VEPIAIIGIGCRFPGAKDPESFWQLLRNGGDAIAQVPKERWDIDEFYDPEPGKPGKMNTRWGGFLDQVDQFEPSFFGISPREVERMDPQQRLVLEVAWEALENAGLAPEKVSGTQTGVFMGIGNYDYCRLLTKDISLVNAYDGTGNTLSIAANRLSYILNLRGPSVLIETACSSSMVALHFACQSLQSGETNMCLVGGASLMLSPEPFITYSHARMMAADGRCKTFDASADGYVRGEGCGVVVLKRLSDAVRDEDNILAVIKGTAVNQDGLSNGLTAPNGPSQQAVIRQALENAGVTPAEISYVEAHGTGTSLGDPIEVKSLKAVLMQGREPDQPCWLGSVKTNIGHLEAASGMASLIKVALSLQHKEIPPHLHLKQLNPLISFEGTTFAIPTECQPWSAGTESRLAGISAFGFGGTNCHAILEEAPSREMGRVPNTISPQAQDSTTSLNGASTPQHSIKGDRPHHLLTLSAKSENALKELAQRYADFLGTHPEASVADVCFTASTGRSHFDQRLAVVSESTEQLQETLLAFTAGKETAGLVSSQVQTKKRQKIAFLFTGQGSQYVGMGRQLYETQPIFRQTLDHCDKILRSYLEQPLLEVLYPEPGKSSP
jgi:acyl transferase domain-containing protein